ncbi:MAG TPA: pyridoxamine 5'-phosphate oxidase family protein [Nocardioidaceae bacterium]|nr:pyridoxamine 5'-phosphate oxidase family protein [Nocardioidaceae bacterium]
MNRPSGHRAAGLYPKVRDLTPSECWALVTPGGVGRIGTTVDEGQVVLPVNYVVDDGEVVIRTTAYGLLGRLGPASEVAFEVDHLEKEMRAGWSVLLVGQMERIDDPDEAAALWRDRDPDPWVGGVRNLFLRIRPRRITGRRIERS